MSQSGETFDALAAIQEIKRKSGRVLGIVKLVGSTIARECGRGIYLHGDPAAYAALCCDATVETIRGAAHLAFVDNPRATMSTITRFLDRIEQP